MLQVRSLCDATEQRNDFLNHKSSVLLMFSHPSLVLSVTHILLRPHFIRNQRRHLWLNAAALSPPPSLVSFHSTMLHLHVLHLLLLYNDPLSHAHLLVLQQIFIMMFYSASTNRRGCSDYLQRRIEAH